MRPSVFSARARGGDKAPIRYAQCWEDADVLLEALDIRPGQVCLSIASAGDNTLAMLTRDPAKVIAVDLSPAQIACLEIRIAAYRILDHAELLEVIGERPSHRRSALYARIRDAMPAEARTFWDARPWAIRAGIGSVGRFERYVALFRRFVLPLIHSAACVDKLFLPRPPSERIRFYDEVWDNARWRLFVLAYCSRVVAARIGRDPRFFRFVDGSIGPRVLAGATRGLTLLDPSTNPYLRWIAFGHYGDTLPVALQQRHFAVIRHNLDRVECATASLQEYLARSADASIDRFNLSDVFEYLSEADAAAHYAEIARVGAKGGRLAYWNTFVPRQRPEGLANRLWPMSELAARLHRQDRVFFYERFVVEEIA